MAARVTLTKTAAPGGYATAAVAVTMTAAQAVADYNQFRPSGNDILVVQNTGAEERTFGITSVADPYGRTGTITAETIAAGVIKVFGPIATLGWTQTDGYVYVAANHAEVKFGIVEV